MLVRTDGRRREGINVKKMKSLALRKMSNQGGPEAWTYTWDQKPAKGELVSDSAWSKEAKSMCFVLIYCVQRRDLVGVHKRNKDKEQNSPLLNPKKISANYH